MKMKSLMTEVEHLTYDFDDHTGFLSMPDGCCCDMKGCIGLFKLIDPKVKEIRTFAGGKQDTMYVLGLDGWKALTPGIGIANH